MRGGLAALLMGLLFVSPAPMELSKPIVSVSRSEGAGVESGVFPFERGSQPWPYEPSRSPKQKWEIVWGADSHNRTILKLKNVKTQRIVRLTEELVGVRNMLWLEEDLVCFSVSQSSAESRGIYLWDLATGMVGQLVTPSIPGPVDGSWVDRFMLRAWWPRIREVDFDHGDEKSMAVDYRSVRVSLPLDLDRLLPVSSADCPTAVTPYDSHGPRSGTFDFGSIVSPGGEWRAFFQADECDGRKLWAVNRKSGKFLPLKEEAGETVWIDEGVLCYSRGGFWCDGGAAPQISVWLVGQDRTRRLLDWTVSDHDADRCFLVAWRPDRHQITFEFPVEIPWKDQWPRIYRMTIPGQ